MADDPNAVPDHSIEAALANMQPLRDLAKNWDIDIASFLDDYLQDIIVSHLNKDDSISMMQENQVDGPNFAQAALLLQNSSHVYSRKVEYLYSLVYAALDELALSFSSQKNPRSSRTTADASMDDFLAFDPDMQFLLLDDVLPTDDTLGGDKINLNERDDDDDDDHFDYTANRSRLATSIISQTRLSLGGLSVVTNLDQSHASVSSNEARNLMGSLNVEGGNLRLLNGNCHVGDHGMLIMPGTAVPGSTNNNRGEARGNHKEKTVNHDNDAMMLDDNHDNDGIGFDLAADEDPSVGDLTNHEDPPAIMQLQATAKNVETSRADPWALLDPHDVGTQKPKPLFIGITYRLPEGLTEPPSKSVTGSHTRKRTLRTLKSPVERPAAPVLSIATETFKATVANRRHQQAAAAAAAALTSLDYSNSAGGNHGSMNNGSMYYTTIVAPPKVPLFQGLAFGDEFAYIAKANAKRKAAERRERRKLFLQEPEQEAMEEADTLFGFDDFDNGSVGGGDLDGIGNTGIASSFPDAYTSPNAKDTSNLDAIEFEALCRAHIKAFAKGAEKYATETNLTKRVGDWQSKLAPILKEEERRPEFNIHNYGDRVIELLQDEIETRGLSEDDDPKKRHVVSFQQITRGCEEYEVCRLFLASLNLTSAGNVSFTSNSMDSLNVKLLNARVDRPMETYMAPSASAP